MTVQDPNLLAACQPELGTFSGKGESRRLALGNINAWVNHLQFIRQNFEVEQRAIAEQSEKRNEALKEKDIHFSNSADTGITSSVLVTSTIFVGISSQVTWQ